MHINPPLWHEFVAPPIYESHVFSFGGRRGNAKSGRDLRNIVKGRDMESIQLLQKKNSEFLTNLLSIYWGWTWVVFRGSENYLHEFSLHLSLYCCILVLVVSFYSSGVPGGGVLPGYGWVENRMVQMSWLRDQRWIIFSTIGAEYLFRYNFHCPKIIV